eukprot:GHVS01026107.1.p1 GENE.GHVS01026107.1~~GHVS01026107.1.p1  ORF type:complete len:117 (-),score=12.29 GHVS01026107.1:269-619(-)
MPIVVTTKVEQYASLTFVLVVAYFIGLSGGVLTYRYNKRRAARNASTGRVESRVPLLNQTSIEADEKDDLQVRANGYSAPVVEDGGSDQHRGEQQSVVVQSVVVRSGEQQVVNGEQ